MFGALHFPPQPRSQTGNYTLADLTNMYRNFFLSNGTTCPLWTSWSSLPVVAEV
jgi:hypothetical protein